MQEVPNTFPSLFLAYSAVLFIIGAYVFSLVRRVHKLEKRLEEKGK